MKTSLLHSPLLCIACIFFAPIPLYSQVEKPIANGSRSKIEKVEFIGSELHPPRDLWKNILELTADGDFLTKVNIITDRINKWYWDNGYITTFIRIPVQDLNRGILTLEIIPGTLEDVQINGLKKLDPGYITSRIFLASRLALNTQRLLEALQLLQESGLFSSFRSELSQGSSRSQSILTVQVTESPNQEIVLEGNSFESKAVGSEQLILGYRNVNLLGLGDRLFVQGNLTSGKQQGYGEYEIPLTPADTTLRLRGQYGQSRIVTPPIDQFDLRSETGQFGLDLRHPIINTPGETLGLTLTYDKQQNQTRLLGFPFGFDSRFPDGKIPFSVFRMRQDYRLRGENSYFLAATNFNYGVEPESFFSWQFQTQYARVLAPSRLIGIVRAIGQLSGDNLFSEEKFKIGGAYSVRGYEFQCCQGDSGVSISGELRITPWQSGNWRLEIIPFIDFGTVWNNSGLFEQTISSYGLQLGLARENFEITGYCADPLTSIEEIEQTCAVLARLKVKF
jgi:hemolysin activation/secretion protein